MLAGPSTVRAPAAQLQGTRSKGIPETADSSSGHVSLSLAESANNISIQWDASRMHIQNDPVGCPRQTPNDSWTIEPPTLRRRRGEGCRGVEPNKQGQEHLREGPIGSEGAGTAVGAAPSSPHGGVLRRQLRHCHAFAYLCEEYGLDWFGTSTGRQG